MTDEAIDESRLVDALDIPSLQGYIRRIGAKKTNHPLKFMVDEETTDEETQESGDKPIKKKYGRIKTNVATIVVNYDGTIDVICHKHKDIKSYQPTDEEAVQIKDAVANHPNLPRSIVATKANFNDLRLKTGSSQLFAYLTSSGTDVMMVQQRKYFDEEETDKHDFPWSFWSDGEWRQCEPGGLLPLFGLDQISSDKPIMVHEGAKAAQTWQQAIAENDEFFKDHPHSETMRNYAHLGWPGGAPNPHRVDWSPIKRLSPHRNVMIVCDNDYVGEIAVCWISRHLRRSLMRVKFNSKFPASFDLADEWPQHKEWWNGDRYVGPDLSEFTSSATWATDIVKAEGKGRPSFKISDHFAQEWKHSISPDCFFNCNGIARNIYTKEQFNDYVKPFSDVASTADLLVKNITCRVDGLHYSPADPPMDVVTVEGQYLINTYHPGLTKARRGDAAPFTDFMNYLITEDKDRHHLMRWCATLMAVPSVKMNYSVLLVSRSQGVGKGTLAVILTSAVGKHNVSFPSENMLISSGFNGWAAHKRLVVVYEIYAGHNSKAYELLKSIITDPIISVNRKFIEDYTIENWAHIFACSNSYNALHLDDVDRRWLVPRVTNQPREREYWINFYRWIKSGGTEAVMKWAEDYVTEHGAISSADESPSSDAKTAMIDESRSDGQIIAMSFAAIMTDMMKNNDKTVMLVEEIRRCVAAARSLIRTDKYVEKSFTLLQAMMTIPGIFPVKRKDGTYARFSSDGALSYAVANFQPPSEVDWSYLKQFYKRPEEVKTI